MTRLSNLDINRMSLPKHVLTTKRCSEQHCSKGFWKSNGICVDLFVAYNTERCSPIYSITGQKLWHCVATCQYESFSFSHRWNTAKQLWQSVFPSEFSKVPHQSRLPGHYGKIYFQRGSFENLPQGRLLMSPPRSYKTRPRISSSAIAYKGIVYLESAGQLQQLRKQEKHMVCQPVQPLADKIRQDLLSGCIQLGPLCCLNYTAPFISSLVNWTYLYKLVSSTLCKFHLQCKMQRHLVTESRSYIT